MADQDPIPEEDSTTAGSIAGSADAQAPGPDAGCCPQPCNLCSEASEAESKQEGASPSAPQEEGRASEEPQPESAQVSSEGLPPVSEEPGPAFTAEACSESSPCVRETGGGGPIGIVAFLAILCGVAPWVAASAGPEPAAICVTVCVLSLLFTGLAAWVFARQATRRRDGFILAALRRLASGSPSDLDGRDPLSAGFAEAASAFEDRLRSALISQECQLKKASNTELVRVRSLCEGLVEKYAERTHREKKDVEAALDALRADWEKERKERELEREQQSGNVQTLQERLEEAQARLSETEEGLRQEQERYRQAETALREAEGGTASSAAQARELQGKLSLRSSECERLAAEKEARQADMARLHAEVSRLGGQSILFFDRVTAQLRGPLQIIDNLVAKLGPPEKPGKGPSSPPQRPDGDASTEPATPAGGVGEIRSRLAQLSRLVENILDLCRLQSSQLSMVYSEIDVGQLVRRLATDYQVKAKAKDVQFSTVVPPRMPPVVMDARYTSRILGELLSNAVRLTPRGGKVSVKARLVQETESMAAGGDSQPRSQLHLEVADTGPGIPAEHQERIFAAFERGLDPQFTLSDAGAGLGLTLARQFAQTLGGTISLESREGQGSTFTVILPVKVVGAVRAY